MGEILAFIGLGTMGYPMAGHLAAKGHKVTVYNRNTAKAERWVAEHGGAMALSPREAAKGAKLVFACVGNDADLREVAIGPEGAMHGMELGSTFVDHTTTSAELAREMSDMARGMCMYFLDAPVSGGQGGAEKGILTVMVGGKPPAFDMAEPVMQAYARTIMHMGPSGSGQLTKMVNQICIAGLVEGLSEGLHFAEKAGLDPQAVIDVISRGAAQSWQMDNRHKTMIAGEYEHGFAVDWMRKDLGICLEEAKRNGALLPVTTLVDGFYADVQAMGGGRWDTSSLLARLKGK
jgi:3-hydroxyisobutyrate dehydrogenase